MQTLCNTTNTHNQEIIKLTLLKDLEPNGDITTQLMVDPKLEAEAEIIAKEEGILACSHLGQEVLDIYCNVLVNKPKATITFFKKDGDKFSKGDVIAKIQGSAQVLLGTERTILNFLQRLCGVATYANQLTELVKDYKVKVLDTRKTTPGMRPLEKEAFIAGGGTNHRFNLSDMVLIKENHIAFCSQNKAHGLERAIKEAKAKLLASEIEGREKIKIECEVSEESQLEDVIKAEVDTIMLDNFSPERISKALVQIEELKIKHGISKDIKTEASGGINVTNIVDYAKTGVDFISTGSATTKSRNIDLSMLINSQEL